MPFNFQCIHCGGDMSLNRDLGEIQCEDCGRLISGKRPPKPKPKLKQLRKQAPTDDTPAQTWTLGGRIYSGEMNPWLRTMWESLRSQLHQGQREQALATCRRLLEYERDFVDAHIWIAKLTQDPDEQRAHLEKGLALQPRNADLMRMMMVLRGDLTEEEAARAADINYQAETKTVDGIADAQTEVLLCPICRGGLTTTDDGQVACKFCGYTDDTIENAVQPTPETSLVVALIKQRGQGTRWQVGERMVHCNECGAERVLPPAKLTHRCPFCHSKHVILQDTHGVFRQPDGIVRFSIGKKQVEKMLHERLNSHMERFKGWFINNRVSRLDYSGVFLPFWTFDIYGSALIRDTAEDQPAGLPPVKTESSEQVRNAFVPGVTSPPHKALQQIADYDPGEAIAYTPKLLAKFAAELYQIEFDRASLHARELFREHVTQRHKNPNPEVRRTIFSQVDHMDLRLLLLPVWVVTVTEDDGDKRLALFNGQTGRFVLGRARPATP